MSGFLEDCVTECATRVTAAGLRAVTDPRNLTPKSVLIELPTFQSVNVNVAAVTVRLVVVAAPPGNSDATDWIITACDTLMTSGMAITDGGPLTLIVGDMELPAYTLTAQLGTRRY